MPPPIFETPLVGSNFQVRVTLHGPRGGSARERDLAVSHVEMPPFRLDGGKVTDDGDSRDPWAVTNLVLRRGHTGSPELYEWWRAERDRERHRVREVTVFVLDDEHRPVTGWHFTGCNIVSLDFSTLDATASSVLMESVELTFKQVDQISLRD